MIQVIKHRQNGTALHNNVNHMGIRKKKTELLVHESIYWANINNDIEKFIENCTIFLTFQQTQHKEKIIHLDILVRLWNIISADMFTLDNKQYLCIVDCHSKLTIVKKTEDLSAYSLILACKIFVVEYGMPKNNVRFWW